MTRGKSQARTVHHVPAAEHQTGNSGRRRCRQDVHADILLVQKVSRQLRSHCVSTNLWCTHCVSTNLLCTRCVSTNFLCTHCGSMSLLFMYRVSMIVLCTYRVSMSLLCMHRVSMSLLFMYHVSMIILCVYCVSGTYRVGLRTQSTSSRRTHL